MNAAFPFLLLSFAVSACPQRTSSPGQDPPRLVRFVLINMSGMARDVHYRRKVVALPVAERVVLQIPACDNIEVTSQTNTEVKKFVTITPEDEGRTITVH